jgi:hypothetical protein
MQRLGSARAEEFRLTLSALHRRREVLVQTQKQLVVLMHGWLGNPSRTATQSRCWCRAVSPVCLSCEHHPRKSERGA